MVKKLVKVVLHSIDNLIKTDLYGRALKRAQEFEEVWYSSNFLNTLRRRVSPSIVRLKYKLGIKKDSLKLHLGCGDKHFENYINIDWRKTKATDLVCNIKKLPYPDNSVVLIETYHVIEHLPIPALAVVLEEWHRLLMHGGKLIIECPDFDEAVKEYIEGNEKRISNIFGLQRFPGDVHLFGYNFKRLKQLLENFGFKDIQKKEPQDYHAENEPCLRVECVKG